MVINITRLSAVFTIIAFSSFTSPASAQAAACDSGWRFENLSIGFGGDSITGTPSVLHWKQDNVGSRNDVFARNVEGQLLQYLQVQSSDPEPSESSVPLGVWYRENLSTITGSNPNLVTDPVAVLGEQRVNQISYDRHDVFAVNRNDDLIHYWWSAIPPSGWHHENLTTSPSGTAIGEKILTKPVVINDYDSVSGLKTDVFSLNQRRHLIHYWWTATTGWDSKNLTMDRNGAFLGEPFDRGQPLSVSMDRKVVGSKVYNDIHVFGRGIADKLLHYYHYYHYWRGGPNWRWLFENVTRDAFGANPNIASDVATTDGGPVTFPAFSGIFGIFGFDGSNLIRYRSRGSNDIWKSEDVTGTFGLFSSSGAIHGKPSVNVSSQATSSLNLRRHDIFARDENRHLIHYWSAVDFYTQWIMFGWQPGENLTTRIGGIPIHTDPVVATGPFYSYQQYVFARSFNELAMYCWDPSSGWKSQNLRAISLPRGKDVRGTPVLENDDPNALYVYVPGRDGDLLRYWRRK